MKKSVLLITSNKEIERQILDSLPLNCSLISTIASDLMMKVYEHSPIVLLVDLDYISVETIDMINSTLSLIYIPVAYIGNKNNSIDLALLQDEVTLDIHRLDYELNNLIKQAANFKRKYDELSESYDAMDLLSGNVKALLSNPTIPISQEKDYLIAELFNLVLSKNSFISNKPEQFWIIQPTGDRFTGKLFVLSPSGYFILKDSIEMTSNLTFAHDISSENGFYKNCYSEEISDIDSIAGLLPKSMHKTSGKIRNFVGYSIDNITILGMNYSNLVSNYEMSIIKSISTYYELITTINTNVHELKEAFEYTSDALARAAEVNDDSTGSHIKRVNTFSKILSEELGLEEDFINGIYTAAQMHDVGKIYVDKNILTKPGKLTFEEFEDMKKHTIYGEVIIGNSQHLRMSAEIARNHHEKFDGTGYPDGKKGEEIPLSARIVALADIYDALRSKRSYKPGFTHEEAYDIITKGDDRVMPQHFDPEVLKAFENVHLKFDEVFSLLTE